MRDHATVEQLLVLANIEGLNAEFIHMGLKPGRPPEASQPNRHPSVADAHRPLARAAIGTTEGGKGMSARRYETPMPQQVSRVADVEAKVNRHRPVFRVAEELESTSPRTPGGRIGREVETGDGLRPLKHARGNPDTE
jgi:hypothetical protein